MLQSSFVKLLIAFVFLALLAGCNKSPFKVTQSNCPATSIMAGTGTFTHFKGEGRSDADVVYVATISHIDSLCEQTDAAIHHKVGFSVVVERGPAMDSAGMTVEVPYFVALMRDNNMITNKKMFTASVRFGSSDKARAQREHIVQSFDDLDIARRYDYELLVGFQISGKELAHNLLN